MRILIATRNPGKVSELTDLVSELELELIGLDEFSNVPEVEETGSTYSENARIKACAYASKTGMHTVADDSGLEVAAIGGKPGVYSARYGGASANYDLKIQRLLNEIAESNSADRSARFVASIAFASPSGKIIFESEGVCEGTIADHPRGSNGFGYDPIFVPLGFDKTFGELGDDVKREISHRARASRKIMRFLRDFA